jgi:ribonuclease G
MKKNIIINSTGSEHRIAILEDGRLAELFVETPGKERNIGDIYLGRVAKVMPGIRASFVEIGLSQDAFLHFSDVGSLEEFSTLFSEDEDEEESNLPDNSNGGNHNASIGSPTNGGLAIVEPPAKPKRPERRSPQVNLQKGQEILVQITKEPIGKKGVRVRSAISLPGRFLVLIPFDAQIGVSKKISNFKERKRLRKFVRSILPDNFGAIIRTVAEGKTEEMLKQDLDDLLNKWHNIEKAAKSSKAPALVYNDMDTANSVIRDLFQETVEHVVVDEKKLFREIKGYVQATSSDMADRVEFYSGKEPIFDKYGVEKDIQTLFAKKVWLKSGGYLFIEKTEAMTVIDVNSGRYAAKREQELNSLKTDLEAAREIVHQLRLRDVGGLIVIDFIDLEDDKNRKKIFDEIKKELRYDRAKVTVLPMTEFGIVQITRQRVRQAVQMTFSESCPACGGTGTVHSRASTINQIERWIRRFRGEHYTATIELHVHPMIAEHLTIGVWSRMNRWRLRFFMWIRVVGDSEVAFDDFRFIAGDNDITNDYRS